MSIGFGQFGHVVRRNLNMLYLIENNGVYGLTKGQFSASADPGSKAKKGEVNVMQSIDPVTTAIALGGSFVARGFSGDRAQLVPLIKAAIRHEGCAVLDVISPCVTFNDHEGSTKSYAYTRRNYHPAVYTDFVPPAEPIEAEQKEGKVVSVTLHDGSRIRLRKADSDYDPSDRSAVMHYLEERRAKGEVVTGLLYIDEDLPEMHAISKTEATPLASRGFGDLSPGAEALAKLQKGMR